MNLFGNSKKVIDSKIEIESVNHSLAKYETDIKLKFSSEVKDFVDIVVSTVSPTGTENAVAHTFDNAQLDDLIGQLKEIQDKLVYNTDIKDYPIEQIERLYFSIIENFCKFDRSSNHFPVPKINIYLDGDKVRLTAVDFYNNRILFNNIISIDYLELYMPNGGSKRRENDIFEAVITAVSSEFMIEMNERQRIFEDDYEKFRYLGDKQVLVLKEVGVDKIIRDYFYDNTTVEEDVINLLR